ncbi:hypothetical protein [Lysinibacillus fusiformis]|uniref:hypothetical protein n=1 Tax=Lysinibacillus fusiformis TaxID=28031 RepID=UPI003D01D4BF
MASINFEEINRTKSMGNYGKEKITMDVIARVLGEGLEFPLKVSFDDGLVFYDKEYVRRQLRNEGLSTMFRISLRNWMGERV